MSKIEWGNKRTCQECNVRFYDLQRNPIICPACSSVYEFPGSKRQRTKTQAEFKERDERDDTEEDFLDLELEAELDETLSDDDLIESTDDLEDDLDTMNALTDIESEDEEE